MRIILDAMGGDLAPREPVRGAIMARNEFGCDITLVGQEVAIQKVLEQDGISQLPPGIDIVNATQVIEICDNPSTAWHDKKDSSMTVGLKMLRDGTGDAFISAGSTGALLSAGTLIVKRIPGIRRAAVAPIVPTGAGHAVLIDAGANSECTPEYMCQFALMGSFYAEMVLGRENPKVGLLNIGSEPSKGSELYKQVHQMLTRAGEAGKLNFVGNVEPTSIASEDAVDVIVADGFVGNILLKAMEGTANFLVKGLKDVFTTNLKTKLGYLMIQGNMGGFKKMIDSRETGGTAMLGLRKPVFKAHGSSDAYAISHAIGKAVEFVNAGFVDAIAEHVDSFQLSTEEK
ncbi:MAG: phosphate acyltransferase PlsX [Clostridiales bacterium]|nr:phosphate acyltransferase PlsX [Clostridiales bacterium]